MLMTYIDRYRYLRLNHRSNIHLIFIIQEFIIMKSCTRTNQSYKYDVF